MKHNKGFTLLELSIVLVIIGLLAGAIVVGEDLISNAAVRGTIADVEKLDTAVQAFRLKYDSLPGDTKKAVMLGLGTPGGPGDNGDGDGTIFSGMFMFDKGRPGEPKELANAFYHLSLSGIYPSNAKGHQAVPGMEPFDDYLPPTRISDRALMSVMSIHPEPASSDVDLGNSIVIHGYTPYPASNEMSWTMTAQQAFNIDSKLDDGLPTSGSVQTNYGYAGPRITYSGNGCAFQDYGALVPTYDVQGLWENYMLQVANSPPRPNQIKCSLGIKGSW